jgi:anti-sigma B factor antagonist
LLATESTKTDVLSIRVTDRDWGAAVALSGRITIDSSPDLRARLQQILNRKTLSMLLIDATAVSYIDLSGIATLVEALKIARTRKIAFHLTGLSDRPRYLFEVTGLLGLFESQGKENDSSLPKVM